MYFGGPPLKVGLWELDLWEAHVAKVGTDLQGFEGLQMLWHVCQFFFQISKHCDGLW